MVICELPIAIGSRGRKMTKSRLIVVDISSFIFRAFYAIRLLHAPDGTPVNAVHGVLSMLLKLLSTYRPSHILIVRDTKGPSFRHKIYEKYKANRSDPPEELIPQFNLIKELVEKMGFSHVAMDGYEADDLIGSVCTQWQKHFDDVYIASSDKDLMQFVNDKVKVLDTMKNKIYDRDEVYHKMGVWPDQIVDYLSMVGDPSDNIPGMKGIGAKGAAQLIATHKSLDECIAQADSFTNKRIKNAFENYLDDAYLSKRLVTIPTDIKLSLSHKEVAFEFYPSHDLLDFLKRFGFKTLVEKVKEIKYAKDHENEQGEPSPSKVSSPNYHFVTTENFQEFFKTLKEKKKMSVALSFSSEDYLRGVSALALSFDGKRSFYLAFSLSGGDEISSLSEKQRVQVFKEIVAKKSKYLIGGQIKKLFSFCLFQGIEINCQYDDILIANYVAHNPSRSDVREIAFKFLDYDIQEQDQNDRLCEDAILYYRLFPLLVEKLEREENKVYHEIEIPLSPILAEMEVHGFQINSAYLNHLEKEYSSMLMEIQEEIEREVGEIINLNSPKQVATLLFEKLQLPAMKKIKTGFSTDMDVLTDLDAKKFSPVPGLIIRYRELEKLLSTYVKALPQLIDPQTQRLHTHLNQIVTATGRLSSDRPNLQNIPIRTEYGKRIRKAFIAKPGHLLLSADYSQVELRLLAHFSSDPTMVKAFKKGQDVHAQTAAEIMEVPLGDIRSEDRSRAKTVNFALMYGQSSFGLAKSLKISRSEARDYMTGYFQRFSRVKSYLDELKEQCAKTGYAITLYGRKRFLPDISSQNRTIRGNAERIAVNSPIQGTAADIIKLAMIAIHREIKQRKIRSKMILQVHDELIFEVLEEEWQEVKELVIRCMESVVQLKVPLVVDVGGGVNWYDIK